MIGHRLTLNVITDLTASGVGEEEQSLLLSYDVASRSGGVSIDEQRIGRYCICRSEGRQWSIKRAGILLSKPTGTDADPARFWRDSG